MKPIYKKILWYAGLVVACFVILDANYFAAYFGYIFSGHTTSYFYVAPSGGASAQIILPSSGISLPRLGLLLPIVYANKADEADVQQDLDSGVVHYPGTANPGQIGNCYIFGHSSDFIWSKGKYKTAFTLLPEVAIGDQILITNAAGQQFTYIVNKTFVVSASDTSVLSQNTSGQALLTLQTSYPVGTALARYIVVAELKK